MQFVVCAAVLADYQVLRYVMEVMTENSFVMLIWLVWQDNTGNPCQNGEYRIVAK